MVITVRDEVYKYRDREFNIKLLKTVVGFFLFIYDPQTKKG